MNRTIFLEFFSRKAYSIKEHNHYIFAISDKEAFYNLYAMVHILDIVGVA